MSDRREYLRAYQNRPDVRERYKDKRREYEQSPEVKAKRKAYGQTPEGKAKRAAAKAAYNERLKAKRAEEKTPPDPMIAEARKERRKAYLKAYDTKPEVRERKRQHAPGWHKQRYAEIKSDPEKLADHNAKNYAWRTGIDRKTFDALMALQDGKCAICEKPVNGRQARRDHCHDTQAPRGILCHHCNVMEGMLRGTGLTPFQFLVRMEQYLAHPPYLKLG